MGQHLLCPRYDISRVIIFAMTLGHFWNNLEEYEAMLKVKP